MTIDLTALGQQQEQELHRDRISRVYLGEISDDETQRRARDRIDWIVEQTEGPRVYDIGCSEGITAIKLAEKGLEVEAIDIHPEVLAYARELTEKMLSPSKPAPSFRLQDIFKLEEIAPEFSTVILGEVLEHVYEPGHMLARAALALKTGGRMILTTPWGYFPAPDHHQTFYLTNFLAQLPPELNIEHLSIADGYIRLLARKDYDPRDADAARRDAPAGVPSTELVLKVTEEATLASQVFLRNLFEMQTARLKASWETAEKWKTGSIQQQERLQSTLKAHEEARQEWRRTAAAEREARLKAKDLEQRLHAEKAKRKEQLDAARAEHKEQLGAEKKAHRRAMKEQKAKHDREITGLRKRLDATQKKLNQRLTLRRHVKLAVKTQINKTWRWLTPWREGGNPQKQPSNSAGAATPKGGDLSAASRVLAKQKPQPVSAADLAVVAAARDFVKLVVAYPSAAGNYGGEFIRTRAEAYAARGLQGCVVELNPANLQPVLDGDGPLPVLRAHSSQAEAVIKVLAEGTARVLVHSPSPELQDLLRSSLKSERLLYWFHGFDARDPRRLFYNYNTAEREIQRAALDQVNRSRIEAAQKSFPDAALAKIFVSRFTVEMATRDMGVSPENAHVIPNFIDGDFYRPVERGAGAERRILLLRPFKQRNYGGDIAAEAIRQLAGRPGFESLSFTVRGFGKEFLEATAPLAELANVLVEERYSSRQEMRDLYGQHGIFLCPSRHDTQGVTLGEAMASGMACITNDVAAIPEFADGTCAVLVRPDDPRAYADAIWELAHDPGRVARLGAAAAARARAQCGVSETIEREVELIAADRGRS